jgi:hypothetical protein
MGKCIVANASNRKIEIRVARFTQLGNLWPFGGKQKLKYEEIV